MVDFTTYNYPACLIVGCYYEQSTFVTHYRIRHGIPIMITMPFVSWQPVGPLLKVKLKGAKGTRLT